MEEVKVPKAGEIEKNQILNKIKQLTTSLGIYQFGLLDEPDPSYGYALDDQARALIVADGFDAKDLKEIFIQYIIRSQRTDGLLYQFCDDKGSFVDNSSIDLTQASQDAYGETIWAICQTKSQNNPKIKIILENLLKYTDSWTMVRPVSYALLGLTYQETQTSLEKKLVKILLDSFKKHSDCGWQWFEYELSYANPIIPWSLWQNYLVRKDNDARQAAEKSTKFLLEICNRDGVPFPIGNKGWYKKGQEKTIYDQQPIDVGYMVCTLETAYLATNDTFYLKQAKDWYGWFFGNNTQKVKMITDDFGCYDGLTQNGPSFNQGAESTICFLMAYLAAKRLNL